MQSRRRVKHTWDSIIKNMEGKNKFSIFVMIILGIVMYFLLGEWICLEKDSHTYMKLQLTEGVMPVYPLFLMLMERVLGQNNYLYGIVIVQGILAIFCTSYFTLMLQKVIKFKNIERIVVFVMCMLPFSIELPRVCATHWIMTEGISYSLFYIFFTCIIFSIWTNKFSWLVASYVMAFVMALTRSQMIFLFIVCGLVLVYMCVRKIFVKGINKVAIIMGSAIFAGIMMLGAYKLVYQVCGTLQNLQKESDNSNITIEQKNRNESTNINNREVDSQLTSLIVIRGFYEAEESDVELFDNEMMQYIFREAYKIANEEGHLYSNANEKNSYAGAMNNGSIVSKLSNAVYMYDEQYPEMRNRSLDEIMRELGIKILIHHWDRYLLHTIGFMIPSFVSSIFFRPEGLETICSIIAILLLLLAIWGCIINWKRKEKQYEVQGMLTTIIFIIAMVGIINAIYMGLQRYVVYAMGVFYIFMYLLFKDYIWTLICGVLKHK